MEEYEIRAEQLKFVAGEETFRKIQDRYFFMRDCLNLSVEERTKILQILFNQTAEYVQSEVLKLAEYYRNTSHHQIAVGDYLIKFNTLWDSVAWTDLRDCKLWRRYGPHSVKGTKEWMELEVIENDV